jgi:hypothetical protein
MKRNMGNMDRVIRLVVAAVALLLYFTSTITGTFGIIMLVVAGIFVLTSLINFCPLYRIFGISTCKIS